MIIPGTRCSRRALGASGHHSPMPNASANMNIFCAMTMRRGCAAEINRLLRRTGRGSTSARGCMHKRDGAEGSEDKVRLAKQQGTIYFMIVTIGANRGC